MTSITDKYMFILLPEGEMIDHTTNALKVVDTVHHEVHEGEMFHSEYYAASLANNGSLDIEIATPADKEAHFVFTINAGGQAVAYLYEAPTVAGGTAMAVHNMNRRSANLPGTTIVHTPTVSATGTTVLVNGRLLAGGTSVQTRVGGGVRQNTEWILRPGTKYLLRVTNTSGSAVPINVACEFYEEPIEG